MVDGELVPRLQLMSPHKHKKIKLITQPC